MNELVTKVAQRAGISEDQARQAIDVVVSHLKQHLPAPIASHLDAVLQGGGQTGGGAGLGGLAGDLGGLFGKK